LYTDRLFSSLQPQQRRLVDDLERRINPLFDALNCETLSAGVTQQLLILVDGECLVPILLICFIVCLLPIPLLHYYPFSSFLNFKLSTPDIVLSRDPSWSFLLLDRATLL
jgi:hypothetical protein